RNARAFRNKGYLATLRADELSRNGACQQARLLQHRIRVCVGTVPTAAGVMSATQVITKFDKIDGIMWGNQPGGIGHNLHQSPLFSSEALAELIESYPREHYNIFSMGAQKGDKWYWRQGDLDGMSGKDVLEAISKGRLWLNLRNTSRVDRRYADL